MAQVTIRDLDDDLKARLKRRADRHNRSLEAEIRAILAEATSNETAPKGLGTLTRELFAKDGLTADEVKAINEASAEFRSRPIRTRK